MKDPQTMPYAEIVGEIQSLRATLREKGQRIHELSQVLQSRVRKAGADEYTSRYTAFVLAHTRFVGGLEQGLQRVASFDRIVGTIQKEQKQQEEAEERAKREQAREQRKKRDYTTSTAPLADLADLFGQEMIDDASR